MTGFSLLHGHEEHELNFKSGAVYKHSYFLVAVPSVFDWAFGETTNTFQYSPSEFSWVGAENMIVFK